MSKSLFVIDNLCGGGAEKVLIDILRNLDRDKLEIHLLLFEETGIYLNDLPENVKVKSIFKKESNRIVKNLFKLLLHFNKNLLYRYIDNDYDTEVAFLEGDSTYLVSKSPNKCKKIAWLHTDYQKNRIGKKSREEKIYKNFNKIVCVSSDAKKSFDEVFPAFKEKTKVIYNLIDQDIIIKKSQESINISEDIDIIAIGRLIHLKGFDLLIKAHSNLIKKNIIHNLVIVGEGEEKSNLKKIIKEENVENSVKLLGFKDNPYPYLKKAKIFAMPSRYEGFPLSLCEAITLEKLIIASKCTGPVEILDNGQFGMLFDVESLEQLEDGLLSLLTNEKTINKYKINVRDRKKFFNKNNIIEDIENLIK